MSLTARLKTASESIHGRAERHPFVERLISGTLEPKAYLAYLVKLRGVYQSLESHLHKINTLQAIAERLHLHRSDALSEDIHYFQHAFQTEETNVSPESNYGSRLTDLSQRWPLGLVAHFYTRYLGDLSGGQMLKRCVQKTFRLPDRQGIAFYTFERISSPRRAVSEIKATLDALSLGPASVEALERECIRAFELSVSLFDAALDRDTAANAPRSSFD